MPQYPSTSERNGRNSMGRFHPMRRPSTVRTDRGERSTGTERPTLTTSLTVGRVISVPIQEIVVRPVAEGTPVEGPSGPAG